MSKIDDLLEYMFDGGRPALHEEMAQWMRESRRFRTFADDYRSKIRAKLRNAGSDERMDDVRAELIVAACLLRERQFVLAYEKYAALKQRGPDFTVTYKTHTPFNVEVRRMRGIVPDLADPPALTRKLMAVLCEKVRQMPPSIINLLWLSSDADIPRGELTTAAKRLRQLNDDSSDEFLRRCGFRNLSDFHRHYTRLSAVILPRSGENVVWLNPVARHKPPPGIVLALRRLPAGDGEATGQ